MRALQSPIALGAKRLALSSKIASISDRDPFCRFPDDRYIGRVAAALYLAPLRIPQANQGNVQFCTPLADLAVKCSQRTASRLDDRHRNTRFSGHAHHGIHYKRCLILPVLSL